MKASSVIFWGICTHLVSNSLYADLKNFQRVDMGLYRGAKPNSSEDYQELKYRYGIRTILDLQTIPCEVQHESSEAEKYGMHFVSDPILPILDPSKEKVLDALRVMVDPLEKPVYVHCLLGRDRTGLMVGLYRVHVQNWPADAAYHEMVENGFKKILVYPLYEFFRDHSEPGTL